MLITFDPSKITFQKVKFKRITAALGGYVSVLDEDDFAKTGKETFHKHDCPVAVARAFTAKQGSGQFMRPTEGCITFYDGRVVALELASRTFKNERMTMGLNGEMREWLTQSEANFRTKRLPEMDNGSWYFDGVYAYAFNNTDLVQVVKDAPLLSSDGRFRDVRCQAFNLTKLSAGGEALSEKHKQKSIDDMLAIEERSCLGFVFDDKFVISPPIWKELQGLHSRKTDGKDIDESEGGVFDTTASLSSMDNQLFVNLQFALAAGKEIAEAFGYAAIAPLQYPKLMIQLKTVNLPNVVKEVKATHDIGMQFTHGLAWLLGLLYRADNIKQMNAIRRMLKYLTSKGVYRKASLETENIRKEESKGVELPPLFSFDDALLNIDTMPTAEWKEAIGVLTRGKGSRSATELLGLNDEDVISA